MKTTRREFLKMAGALAALPPAGFAWAGQAQPKSASLAAAWRGPNAGDTYFAGVRSAD